MYIYLSLLVSIVGLLLYLGTEKPKIAESGRIMFFSGLLVFLLLFSGYAGAHFR